MTQQGLAYNSPFSPGAPLSPYLGYGGEPRRWGFQTGYNIVTRPTRDGRVGFETLKALIDNYDIARMAIEHRIDDVRSLDFNIVAQKGYTGDADAAISKAKEVLAYPEGPDSITPFRAWLAAYLEDVLRYDAGCLYRRRDRIGRVIGLKVMSGITVAPTLDFWGDTPAPPAVAYTQFANGLPWKEYTTEDIIYLPLRPQPDSAYGFAPLEAILLTANTDLRMQTYFLNWFREGQVAAGYMDAPEGISTPDQLEEYQQYMDALWTGDEAAKHQLKMIANGTQIQWSPEKQFNSEFSLYLMRKVAAAYHVTPADLGFTEDVNKASGETQADVQFRTGTLPLVQHVQDIINSYLQRDRELPVEFSFDTGQEVQDRLTSAQIDQIHIQNGVVSPDEVREREYGLPIDPSMPVQRYVYTARGGPIPLSAYDAVMGPTDNETYSPADGAALPHKPFAPVEGTAPQTPPNAPPLAVQRYPQDNPSSAIAAIQEAVNPAPVTKEITAGITADSGLKGHDLIDDEEEHRGYDVLSGDLPPYDEDDGTDVIKSELAAFKRFAKARRREGKWRDFEFTVLDAETAALVNQTARDSLISKALVKAGPSGPKAGDPRWHAAPVRQIEQKLIDHHAEKLQAAMRSTVTKAQLRSLVEAYMAKQAK